MPLPPIFWRVFSKHLIHPLISLQTFYHNNTSEMKHQWLESISCWKFSEGNIPDLMGLTAVRRQLARRCGVWTEVFLVASPSKRTVLSRQYWSRMNWIRSMGNYMRCSHSSKFYPISLHTLKAIKVATLLSSTALWC